MLAVNPTPLQRGVIRNECQDAVTLDAVVQHGLYVAIAQSAEPLPHKRVRAGSLPAGGTNPRETGGIFMPSRNRTRLGRTYNPGRREKLNKHCEMAEELEIDG